MPTPTIRLAAPVLAICAAAPSPAFSQEDLGGAFAPFTGRVDAADVVGGYRGDAVLIRLAAGAPVEVGPAMAAAGVTDLAPAFASQPADAALAETLGLTRLYAAQVADARLAVRDLAAVDGVLSAELIGIGGILAEIPDDTDFGLQYGLLNTGQTVLGVPGTPGADVNATEAWVLTTGSSDTVIAIVDTGVSLSHPDLQANVLPGYSAVGGTWDDDTFISHGTHCAGIASADTNNGVGIAGVGYNCSILPVKTLGFLGTGTEADIAAGVIWAADNGADVISMSLGSPDFGSVLEATVDYAASQGVVILAATGNTPGADIFAPARYDAVIAVGATNNQDVIADFTTTGPEMDVVAPGQDVWSTWDTPIPLFGPENGYAYQSGTSMACPHVAGVVGLMLSVNPDLSRDQVRTILRDTAVDLGPAGFDETYGYGRVDALEAVIAAGGALGCPADFDGDGELTIFDFLAFQNAFDLGDPAADFDGDGELTIFDFLAFQNAFADGCP
ncbi:MAG: S8 family serine peptidase [Planctomycetota bacterium]